MPTTIVWTTAIVIRNSENKILLTQRPLTSKHGGGKWEFPGGKIDPGETPEISAARELEEELGIVVAPDTLRPLTFANMSFEWGHMVALLYEIRAWQGTPEPLEGQGGLQWVDSVQLSDIDLFDSDKPFAAYIQAQS